MKKLLDKPFHLILKLLEHFYKKTPQETINYYSDFLNVDRRTILKIITDLERDIADCQWENQLTLEVTETKIIATFSTNFSLENFYRYYMERSLCVELVQSIFKEAEISLDQIIENFFVSRTTFYRRVTPLKEVLAEFDLELDFTKKQFLIGEEKQIRYFFSVFFWEIFRSTGEYKHPDLKDTEYLNRIKQDLNLSIPHFLYFQLYLNISLTRISQGYLVSEVIPYPIKEINYSYAQFKNLTAPYFNKLMPAQQSLEIHSLYFLCVTSTIYPKKVTNLIPIQKIPELKFAQQWILYYTNYFDTILSNEDYVYLYLNLSLIYEKNKTFHGGTSSFGVNSVTEVLREENPDVLRYSMQFFSYLSTQEEEFHIAPFQVLSFTLLIRRLLINGAPPLRLLVCSKVGQEETDWIQSSIKKISSVPVEFYSSTSPDLDLIISDFPLPPDLISVSLDKLFLWLTFPSPKEWRSLLKKLEEIYYTKLN